MLLNKTSRFSRRMLKRSELCQATNTAAVMTDFYLHLAEKKAKKQQKSENIVTNLMCIV